MAFLSDAEAVLKALDEYYRESAAAKRPVITQEPLERIISDLDLASHVRRGGLSGENLVRFIERYLSTTTRLHHPAYMGHQVAVPHYAGALGSLIDGFTNNAMAIYEMGPGAASIEFFIINWLLEKAGWEAAPVNGPSIGDRQTFGGGVLTHGGSLANLTAMIAARNRIVPDVWRHGAPGDLALLAPSGSHYSIARAAGILGIGRDSIYSLDVDERGAVIPERLAFACERLENDGKRPIALVANACSTGVGIYDPLQEIGEFCRERDIWFHVDGAHGASALLSERLKGLLRGIGKADSLTWDAHKLLRTPTLCAALLVRDHRYLDGAFEQEASYLFHEKEQPGFDFIHRTVECTKAGLGLKFFLVLGAMGEEAMAEYVERQYDLALRAYDHIEGQEDFHCPVRPQSNILCFRMDGSDERQLKLRDMVNARGDFYFTTTLFNGRRYLRLVLMNPATEMEDIESLIRRLRELEAGMEEDRNNGMME